MPAVGQLEPPGPVAQRPGERPPGVAEELALVQLARHRRAVHLDQRPCRSACSCRCTSRATSSLPVPLSPRIEDGRVGRGHQVDLPGDRFEGRAAGRPARRSAGPRDLLPQVLVLQLQPRAQLLDPLERPGGGDGGGGVVGDRPQPVHAVRPDGPAGEHGQHPEHLRRGGPAAGRRTRPTPSARTQSGPGDPVGAGSGSRSRASIGSPRGRDPPDLPHPQGHAAKRPVHAVSTRWTGTRWTALRWRPGRDTWPCRAGLGRGAAGAVRCRPRQPDPGQGDPRRAAQAGDDQPEQFGHRMLLGHVQQQPLGVRQQRFLSRVVAHPCHFTNFRDFRTKNRESTTFRYDADPRQFGANTV